jgi:hypothetical protein
VVGTDFGLMARIQSRRSKKELLNKYKKEERKCPRKVYHILDNIPNSGRYLKVHDIEPYLP